MSHNTIFALASAPGQSGVAVIRISGASAREIASAVTKMGTFRPRFLYASPFFGYDNTLIDSGMCVYFPAPKSYTGEDIIELYPHGSMAVLRALQDRLQSLGARLAQPGEFTKRALQNGKLDLLQAEAVGDLIHAETDQQRLQALDQLQGGLSQHYTRWSDVLIRSLAYVEAHLDFPEEELDINLTEITRTAVHPIMQDMQQALKNATSHALIHDGIKICILGAPNVGKSSLLNYLARKDVAIVTEYAGTTRDVLQVYMSLGGYKVILYDTAGIRETADIIEREGIRRTMLAAEQADILLYLCDKADQSLAAEILERHISKPAIQVWTKNDHAHNSISEWLRISTHTGSGLEGLLQSVITAVQSVCERQQHGAALATERHRHLVEQCLAQIKLSMAESIGVEIMAEHLRQGLLFLGQLVGRHTPDDVLDIIFKDFCIGK